MPEDYPLIKRQDGKFEQSLGGRWVAEYFENPVDGLWRVDLFLHDVPEWDSNGFQSIEEAQQAVREYIDQQ